MEFLLQLVGADALARREGSQGERERNVAHAQDQTQVDRRGELGVPLEPLPLLQLDEDQGRDDHDGAAVEHPADSRLGDGNGGGLLALAERGNVVLGLALGGQLGLVGLGEHGEHVYAGAHLLAAHEEHVEGTSRRDGSEGHQASEDRACGGRDALQPGHQRVETDGHRARGANRHEVGLGNLAPRQRGRLIGIRVIDGDVERLVGYLPCDRSGCLHEERELSAQTVQTKVCN